MKKILLPIILWCLALCTLFITCKGKKTEFTISQKIKTTGAVDLVTGNITAEGGTLVVNRPGDPLNGLSVEVPLGAFTFGTNIQISSAKIENHDLGPYFKPITPAIAISIDAGTTGEFLKLTIPVEVPDGEFAMAFLYDHKAGRLEGMQMIEAEKDHITVVANRFHVTPPSDRSLSMLRRLFSFVPAFADDKHDLDEKDLVMVTSIPVDELMFTEDTPFKPGVDDWGFSNDRTVISPNGHCSGMSVGMLWYYTEKKLKGFPQLNGQWDNNVNWKTPGIEADDVQAYKFCSYVQDEKDFSDLENKIREMTKSGTDHELDMKMFTYALKLTNEPQFAGLEGATGHAVVVYGAKQGSLHICDPNYRNEERWIHYIPERRKYMTYASGIFKDKNEYDRFIYIAKTTVSSWEFVPSLWGNLSAFAFDNPIWLNDPDNTYKKYPAYSITVQDDNGQDVPLVDGMEIPVRDNKIFVKVNMNGQTAQFVSYKENGDLLMSTRETGSIDVTGLTGELKLGLVILTIENYWVGFKWTPVTLKLAGDNNTTIPNITGPQEGNLSVTSFKVDGVDAVVKKASYKLDDILSLSVELFGERYETGPYAYSHVTKLHARNCTGTGRFPLDNGGDEGGTSYFDVHIYSMRENNPNNAVTLTQNDSNGIAGSFNFEVFDGSGNRKLITGVFSAKSK